MNQPNAEGIQALQELAGSQHDAINHACSGILPNIASCGIVDLDKSVASYHEAQQKAEETRAEVQVLETRISELHKQISECEAQAEVLSTQEAELLAITPVGDATDTLKALFSLVYEIRQAIYIGRGHVEERFSFSYYQLALLERFVLPSLEGNLSPEWSADDMWSTTVDVQITQRIGPHYRNEKRGELPWKEVFADLKTKLSPERLHILVVGVCESEQCNAEQLKTLIAQLREKAKEWPAEYQVR